MGVGRQQQQHSALDTLAAKNRGKNGTTSMETQHVHAGWPQKTQKPQLACNNVPSCHITAHWMTFKSSMIYVLNNGRERFDDTMMMMIK